MRQINPREIILGDISGLEMQPAINVPKDREEWNKIDLKNNDNKNNDNNTNV